MKIGIIGAGNIGKNAAIHFVKIGHQVRLSNGRDPSTMADVIAEVGGESEAATIADTVAFAEVVLLSFPWPKREEAIRSAGSFADKVVIDATNPYTSDFPELEDLGDQTASEVIAGLLPGAKVVKALSTIHYLSLRHKAKSADADKEGSPVGRICLPLCGDDEPAKAVVAGLLSDIGFEPLDVGPLRMGRHLEPFQPLYSRDYVVPQVRAQMARSGIACPAPEGGTNTAA